MGFHPLLAFIAVAIFIPRQIVTLAYIVHQLLHQNGGKTLAVVLDNGQGGTGQRFDWSLLNGAKLDNVLLAGGLGPDNCVEAAKTGCAGLDFNSGVESQPGIKDASKLASVFKTLRAY